MDYFKHWTDSGTSSKMSEIIRIDGLEGYARFFLLLEACSKKIQKVGGLFPERYKFSFHIDQLAVILRTKSVQVGNKLTLFQEQNLLSYSVSGNIFEIDIPKLWESFDRDQRRARKQRAFAAPPVGPKNTESEIKNNGDTCDKPASISSSDPHPLDWNTVSEKAKANWLRKYPKDYIEHEMPEIENWLMCNPRKASKTDRGWIQFLGNWFKNGFSRYQKNIPSQKSKMIKVDFNKPLGAA